MPFKGVTRIVTPEGERVVATAIVEQLLERKLLFKDDHGVVNAQSSGELEKLLAEYGMCDFCSAVEAPHTLIVPDFQMDTPEPLPKTEKMATSTGGWAACDECYELVKQNRRKDLLNRSVEQLGGGKFTAGAIKGLHAQFWKAYDELATAAGMGAVMQDFVEGNVEAYGLKPKMKGRDVRMAAIRRLAGLDEDEMDALMKGDLAYKQVAHKLAEWRKKFGTDYEEARMLAQLTEAGLNRPMPLGAIPHWQVALDSKFETIQGLTKAMQKVEGIAAMFPEAIDLNDPKQLRDTVRKAEVVREFQNMGYAEDIVHLRLSEVYSFNEDTMEAIRMGAESIPHETPLSAVSLPNTTAGWFWFAKPFPVTSSPIASDSTNALLWGWETGEGASYLASKMLGMELAKTTPILRLSAFVYDPEMKMVMPSTKWTWPLGVTFHQMIGINQIAHQKLYGPGAPYEGLPYKVGTDITMKCIAELSLFFLMACVWFKQKIIVGVQGHVERHARKRYQREHKLPKAPEVKVIALRASEHAHTPSEGGNGEGRKYNKWRWVVEGHNRLQPCGPGGKDRKLIWIDSFVKGEADKPLKPKATKVYAVIR